MGIRIVTTYTDAAKELSENSFQTIVMGRSEVERTKCVSRCEPCGTYAVFNWINDGFIKCSDHVLIQTIWKYLIAEIVVVNLRMLQVWITQGWEVILTETGIIQVRHKVRIGRTQDRLEV